MRRSRTIVLTMAACAALTLPAAASGPLAPRDECSALPGFPDFRDALETAVQTRDAEALLDLASEHVKLDFGGGSGKEEWRARLDRESGWAELEEVIALGCGRGGPAGDGYVSFPWYFAKDLISADPFEAMIVTGNGVRLRSGPSLEARVIGEVSWDYVVLADGAVQGGDFVQVETKDGRTGYMASRYLRSLIDHRLIAERDGGRWTITAFVAGD